jgi:hypothetical protein
MFLTSSNNQELFKNIEEIGLTHEIMNKRDVLIKINLGRPTINRPRTDMTILKTVVNYIYENGGRCAIAESSESSLTELLIAYGFEDVLKQYKLKVIDIDSEDYDEVLSYGEHHYIPKCFKEYPVRIAIPATSKRKGMIYSNNIKLFVGAVPRKMYQLDSPDTDNGAPRPKIHQNLHLSVSNLFLAIQSYSPFQFYINGGLSFNENIGEFNFTETFVGNDALELDYHMFKTFFNNCEYPDYLDILKTRVSNE